MHYEIGHRSMKGGKKDDVVQLHSVISKCSFYEDIDYKANNLFYVMTKYNFFSVWFHENAKLHQLNRNHDN